MRQLIETYLGSPWGLAYDCLFFVGWVGAIFSAGVAFFRHKRVMDSIQKVMKMLEDQDQRTFHLLLSISNSILTLMDKR